MKIAIVGAGAAGLMCACMLSTEHNIHVFEKNASAGKKLLVTGNGRCNLTNLVNPYAFLENVPQNSKFLLGSLREFSPKDAVKFFEQLGVPTHVEDDNRVFPSAGKALSVKTAMESFAKARGVNFMFESPVTCIDRASKGFIVSVNGKQELFDAVVIATGGMSFPTTGSTGDGLVIASKFGHSIVPIRPSLCGLQLEKPANLQGASVRCEVQVLNTEFVPVTQKQIGNMLFTKTGVSGPVIYETVSKFKQQSIRGHFLQINFTPSFGMKEFEETFQKLLAENPKKKLVHVVRAFMPLSVADWVIKSAGQCGAKMCGQTTKHERNVLPSFIRSARVPIKDFEDIQFATITRGGVDVHEVNPQTMESKLIPNLFFIGEVLDIDALSGGFNLQIAFSTAVVCARGLL